jgi:hypothetical protein
VNRATKYRTRYEHLHLEVIEDDKGWTGRIWNPVNETLIHSADGCGGREDAKDNLLSIARLSLAAEFPDRPWPTIEVQWIDSTDPDYFSLRELG